MYYFSAGKDCKLTMSKNLRSKLIADKKDFNAYYDECLKHRYAIPEVFADYKKALAIHNGQRLISQDSDSDDDDDDIDSDSDSDAAEFGKVIGLLAYFNQFR